MDIPSLFDSSPGGSAALEDEWRAARRRVLEEAASVRDSVSSEACEVIDDDALLASLGDLAAGVRDLELALAHLSVQVHQRSIGRPAGGLAKARGHRDSADLIAASMRGSRAEAHRLIEAGQTVVDARRRAEWRRQEQERRLEEEARRAEEERRRLEEEARRRAEGGGPGDPDDADEDPPDPDNRPDPDDPPPPEEPEPPAFPHVAAALESGRLSVEFATAITTMLEALDPDHVGADRIEAAERDLVERAAGLTLDQLQRIVRRFRASLDAQAHQRRLERLREQRTLTLRESRDGMVDISGRLDPETAAAVRAALEALVGDAMRRSRDALGEDTRTTGQMRADALAALCRHAIGCDASTLPLSTTTVVVRMTLEDLRRGNGQAELDGSTEPVDIDTARRLAASADVIPAVLGSKGELLNLGRRQRLFSNAQRCALVERDGGCAKCGAPPGWTEAHHIRWWGRDRGATDLRNGVLLCSHCHHEIHRAGWEIDAGPTEVWFIPPASVDPQRRRRRGGRARFFPPPAA
ncbi:HNH endonuclease signature motif containing protein [Demequina pelophila]|uniref:HNH endonuclease signature motif containing protein n=1 Tax=Demequina pelophila TaxID=1638984 RepID=UPI0007864FCA|nr:HNH endonuclease signature motif containing protein [Demequina pelophila]